MKKFTSLILAVFMMLNLVACGTKTTPATTPEASSTTPEVTSPAASSDSSAGRYLDSLQAPAAKRALCMGTASSSGTWYILGGAISNSINNHSDWFTITNEASSGGGENLRNLQDGVIDIAMLNSDMGYFFYTSTESYEGAGSDQLRALFALPSAAMHIVVRENSDIHSVEDLKGKRVAVGLAGSGYELFASKVIANAGLSYDDMTVQMINPSQMPEALQNNQVDAFFFPLQVPASTLTELALNTDIRFISLDDSFREKYQSTYVGYVEMVIPAGTYKGQEEDVTTLATGQFVSTLADSMTEEEAYVFMCDVFDNRDEWVNSHYTAKELAFENINGLFVPLHAGVCKFLEENDVVIPDNLIPPEAK